MSLKTFHLFRLLPPEIQNMIWEAAVRPAGEGVIGIHSLHLCRIDRSDFQHAGEQTVRYVERGGRKYPTVGNIASPMNLVDARKAACILDTDGHGNHNRSAYLWDAGLWTACLDSHRVMERHFGKMRYRAKQREGQPCGGNSEESQDHYPVTAKPEGQTIKHPIIRRFHSDEDARKEDWVFAVHPFQDAFKLSHEFSKYRYMPLPACFSCPGCPGRLFLTLGWEYGEKLSRIRNLVFEFDPDWSEGLADLPAGFWKGSPPVTEIVESVVGSDCLLWLIDRGGYRGEKPPSSRSSLLFDYDECYVEINKDDYFHEPSSAGYFARLFGRRYCHHHGAQFGGSIEWQLRVLRPRKMMPVSQ